jgi:predicted RNA-binding Zn-ribbon protein involved in translation (DUF1610 family)
MNVRATCPTCGDVVVPRGAMKIRVCAEDRSAAYGFRCPLCSESVVKAAEDRIVQLLVAGGVEVEVWHLPDEMYEEHAGAAITHDDVLDFHMAMRKDDWTDQILA